MKIKEKVLKEVFDEFFDKDIIEDAYVNSYLDEQIGNGLKKAINLILVEVGKVIDERIKQLKKEKDVSGKKKVCDTVYLHIYDMIRELKELKQKLGIK